MAKTQIDPEKSYRSVEVRNFLKEYLDISAKGFYRTHQHLIPGWYYVSSFRRLFGKDLIAYIDAIKKNKRPLEKYARDKKSNY